MTETRKLPDELLENYEYYKQWIGSASPKKFLEYSQENSALVQKMKPEYVATEHDTCDNSQITTGFHDFGPEPRCCWVTHGWYICENEYKPDDYITASGYATCADCNPNGDGDFEEESANPECELCYGDGSVNYYFDDYASSEGLFDTLEIEEEAE